MSIHFLRSLPLSTGIFFFFPSNRYLHTHVHGSITHGSQEVEAIKCPLIGEWINKIWSIHTRESDSASKRKELLTHTTTKTNLKNITLPETSQSQIDKYHTIPLL